MSLTSELSETQSPLGGLFRQTLNTRAFVEAFHGEIKDKDILAGRSLQQADYGWLGMAIDYRLRYYLKVTPFHDLTAFNGLGQLHRHKALQSGVYSYFASLHEFLVLNQVAKRRLEIGLESELNRHCLVLAKLEVLYRACWAILSDSAREFYFQFDKFNHVPMQKATQEILAGIPDVAVQSMNELSFIFWEKGQHWLKYKRIHLNPIFARSRDIGGADADLIINGTLLDLKNRARIGNTDIFQLISYALLAEDSRIAVRRVGFYLPRYGHEKTWDLGELFAQLRPTCALSKFKRKFSGALNKTELKYSQYYW